LAVKKLDNSFKKPQTREHPYTGNKIKLGIDRRGKTDDQFPSEIQRSVEEPEEVSKTLWDLRG
jgi:hypothetical protein